jgi:hypothetical protein
MSLPDTMLPHVSSGGRSPVSVLVASEPGGMGRYGLRRWVAFAGHIILDTNGKIRRCVA